MRIGLLRSIFIISAVLAFVGNAAAQTQRNDSPVRISFDRASKRLDIVTGKTLPDYTQAQRGSVQFFQGRLDKPENGFWYFFDGRRFQPVDRTLFIRKLKATGTWLIGGSSRWGEPDQTKNPVVPTTHPNVNCVIQHHAVSFIPLNPSTGKPGPRVYVLLEDMELMQWYPYNNWLVTESQDRVESKQGVVF
jgi:hypothetical protein